MNFEFDNKLEFQILMIGNRAIRKAQKESLKKRISNVYCQDDVLYFQLLDGTITTEIPEIYKKMVKSEYLK